ncbi:hypothetical protein [Nocardia carnea]|uniref:hypothetical protein n=1 Tax=Nocardia carnea TaxID=37328 RepID=UPI002455BF8E|nr:hypothetical protein [Nocardia carnea]
MKTTIRTFAVVVAADAAVLGVLYALDKYQSTKSDRDFRSARPAIASAEPMTSAEHAELDRLRRYETGTVDLPDYFPSRAAYLEAVAGYNIDLLDGEVFMLASMSVRQLIAEITHAKANLRRARKLRSADYTVDSSAVEMWLEHLGALRAEFNFRLEHLRTLPELDQARMDAAAAGVRTITDEWPPFGLTTARTDTDTTVADQADAEIMENQE